MSNVAAFAAMAIDKAMLYRKHRGVIPHQSRRQLISLMRQYSPYLTPVAALARSIRALFNCSVIAFPHAAPVSSSASLSAPHSINVIQQRICRQNYAAGRGPTLCGRALLNGERIERAVAERRALSRTPVFYPI